MVPWSCQTRAEAARTAPRRPKGFGAALRRAPAVVAAPRALRASQGAWRTTCGGAQRASLSFRTSFDVLSRRRKRKATTMRVRQRCWVLDARDTDATALTSTWTSSSVETLRSDPKAMRPATRRPTWHRRRARGWASRDGARRVRAVIEANSAPRKMPKLKLPGLLLQIGSRPAGRYPVCPLRPRQVPSDRGCPLSDPLASKGDEWASSRIRGPFSDFLATIRQADTADRPLFGQNPPQNLEGEPVRRRRFAANWGVSC